MRTGQGAMRFLLVQFLALLAVMFLVAGASAQSGFYGFANSPNINQETNLRNRCGNFTRVTAKGDFNALCASRNLKCDYVCDWEGHRKACNENPQDGSRVAYCSSTPHPLAGTCTTHATNKTVPIGTTECIMHDTYECDANQHWKKTGYDNCAENGHLGPP
jgi:hypothetical protein